VVYSVALVIFNCY